MTFRRSSLLIRKSFLTNALSNCGLYTILFQLSLASILFSIFLLCLCIVRKPAVFDFITCLSFCKEIIVAYQRRAESFYCSFENVLKLTRDPKQLAAITYFSLENVNKHDFFEILLFPVSRAWKAAILAEVAFRRYSRNRCSEQTCRIFEKYVLNSSLL